MNAKSVIIFFVCLNVAAYMVGWLISEQVLIPGSQSEFPYTDPQLDQIKNQFNPLSFSVGNIIYGVVGAGIAGLIGLITKSNTFAVSAAVIWILGIFLNIFSWLTNGAAKIFEILLPPELAFMSYVFSAFISLIFFWFLAGTLTQRPDIGG